MLDGNYINQQANRKEANVEDKKKVEPKIIGFKATEEDLAKIEALKTTLKRPSTSDLLRYLLLCAAENFLPADLLGGKPEAAK